MIAGVEEEEAAYVALIETAGRGAQPAEFPGPSREHPRVHFPGVRILALDEVVPLSQYRGFANKDAAQGPLEIYVALEGWSEPASELRRQMERRARAALSCGRLSAETSSTAGSLGSEAGTG